MSHKYGRIDKNQPGIVAMLRSVGATVALLSDLGNGISDLLVGFRGENFLLEVKDGEGRLTPDEKKWVESWQGVVVVVRSEDEALRAIGAI